MAGTGQRGSTGCVPRVDPERDLIVVFLANRLGWNRRGRERAINAAVAAASQAG